MPKKPTAVRGRPFQPGCKPGPGRPRRTVTEREITELAREHSAAAMDRLVAVIKDRKARHNEAIAAANAILDRGWGKPKQPHELRPKSIDELTEEELVEMIRAGRRDDEAEPGPDRLH